MANGNPRVLIVIGSDSDLPVIEATLSQLEEFQISYELRISSAHRTPEETKSLIKSAPEDDFSLIIAAAGLAAHLPGVCASYTHLPVIGVPMGGGDLNGLDALYSIVMMPPGVPVATVGIGKIGARNAAVLAAQILSLKYPFLADKIKSFKETQREGVLKKDESLRIKKDYD